MNRFLMVLLAGTLGCSDYKFADIDNTEAGADRDSGLTGDTANPDDTDDTDDSGSDPEDPDPDDTGEPYVPGVCDPPSFDGAFVEITDTCPTAPEGGFTPVVEWHAEAGKACRGVPTVGDLDDDGSPEIVITVANLFDVFGGTAELVVLNSNGSVKWRRSAQLGYATSPAIGDVTGDGSPDIAVVKEYASSLFAPPGSYSVVLYDSDGNIHWESALFTGSDFDYATGPILSDMDHDGSTEIVVGRVILNADGSTRAVGIAGRGSIGGGMEASVPAVADLDLDGIEEVIVGNAIFSPDGAPIWIDWTQQDGMVGVANLDDDPEGEFVAVSHDTVRAMDTDGTVMWGPFTITGANIVSPPAIGDIDADGYPEILVAGGNEIWALERDGTLQWSAPVHDETGASGPALFDFEGDGIMEVVYIDEIQMITFDGETGAVKFLSTEHASDTMYDYPVIADMDGDDQAEIIVCHAGYSHAITVYGDADESWPPARKIWNQHAYSITNINDDLTIPVDAIPNFTLYNNWHAAVDRAAGFSLIDDVGAQIADVCLDDCGLDRVVVTVQLINYSAAELSEGVALSLYAVIGGTTTWLGTVDESWYLEPGWSSDGVVIEVDATLLEGATALRLVADDDGTGTGAMSECSETNNTDERAGPFCE